MSLNNSMDLPKQLRLLAKALEEGENIPDFVFCVVLDGVPFSAHHCKEDIFRLIGLTNVRLDYLLGEVD